MTLWGDRRLLLQQQQHQQKQKQQQQHQLRLRTGSLGVTNKKGKRNLQRSLTGMGSGVHG
jgi:hypothetical protein